MFYRAVRICREVSALAIIAAYVIAGGAAFVLMFIFPPGSLLILFGALFSLGFVFVGMKSLGWLEHRLAMRLLVDGTCPACDRAGSLLHEETDGWLCAACGSAFMPNGEPANDLPQPAP